MNRLLVKTVLSCRAYTWLNTRNAAVNDRDSIYGGLGQQQKTIKPQDSADWPGER